MNRTKPFEPGVPASQTSPSTRPDAREARTSRPAAGRDLDTPMTPISPKPPRREFPPGKAGP